MAGNEGQTAVTYASSSLVRSTRGTWSHIAMCFPRGSYIGLQPVLSLDFTLTLWYDVLEVRAILLMRAEYT